MTNFIQFSLNSLLRTRGRYDVSWKLPIDIICDQTLLNFPQIHYRAYEGDTIRRFPINVILLHTRRLGASN